MELDTDSQDGFSMSGVLQGYPSQASLEMQFLISMLKVVREQLLASILMVNTPLGNCLSGILTVM